MESVFGTEILFLDDGEIYLFFLEQRSLCQIKVLSNSKEIHEKVLSKLRKPEFWEAHSDTSAIFGDHDGGCEIRVFLFGEDMAFLRIEEGERDALVVFKQSYGRIPEFISNRLDSTDYIDFVFEAWSREGFGQRSILVAGDEGLVLLRRGAKYFLDYTGLHVPRKLCAFNDIKNQIQHLPAGIFPSKYLSRGEGEMHFLRDLAQTVGRSALRAFSFGCES